MRWIQKRGPKAEAVRCDQVVVKFLPAQADRKRDGDRDPSRPGAIQDRPVEPGVAEQQRRQEHTAAKATL